MLFVILDRHGICTHGESGKEHRGFGNVDYGSVAIFTCGPITCPNGSEGCQFRSREVSMNKVIIVPRRGCPDDAGRWHQKVTGHLACEFVIIHRLLPSNLEFKGATS